MFPIALDSRVVNILRGYGYVLWLWFREWSTCWDSISLFYHFGLESGQHVEIPPMFSIALDSRVVSMLRFYDCACSIWDLRVVTIQRFYVYDILGWIREWSTCWVSINMFFYVGLESGQHVDILPMFSIALDSRVANMTRFNEYVLLLWIREWWTCWDSTNVFYCIGFESCQHVDNTWIRSFISGFASGQHFDIQVIWPSILDSRVVNMLMRY